MMELIKIANRNDLKNGEMKQVDTAGHSILLARVGDNYYATAGRCPHMGGKLAEGTLEDTIITCPLHGSQFDLKDGRVIRWTNFTGIAAKIGKVFKAPQPLTTYKIKIVNDDIFVEL